MKTIFLYLKESPHGKKYLGKTIQDPYKYPGTGVLWQKHLKKHKITPSELITTILFETTDKEEFKQVARNYSIQLNIVEDPVFCNLTLEEGQGGDTSEFIDYKSRSTFNPNPKGNKGHRKGYKRITNGTCNKYVHPAELIKWINQGWTTGVASDKHGKHRKGKKPWNYGLSGYSNGKGITRNNKPQQKVTCPHCTKVGGISNMTRWHFNNCKFK